MTKKWYDESILNFVVEPTSISSGSTDVGDVSQIIPTAQVNVVSWAPGTPGHCWQVTAQGKSSFAKKGMLVAAKVMACTAIDFLNDSELVKAAWTEHNEETNGECFVSPLPRHYKPEIW